MSGAKPADAGIRLALAECHCTIGSVLVQSSKPQPAQAECGRAIQILSDIRPPSVGSLYNLACAHALLSAVAGTTGSGATAAQAQTEADRAMSLLRKAVAAGFRDAAHMRRDTDLDALRKRGDFLKLLAELEAKQKAKAP
jgi:hypothetical protein